MLTPLVVVVVKPYVYWRDISAEGRRNDWLLSIRAPPQNTYQMRRHAMKLKGYVTQG